MRRKSRNGRPPGGRSARCANITTHGIVVRCYSLVHIHQGSGSPCREERGAGGIVPGAAGQPPRAAKRRRRRDDQAHIDQRRVVTMLHRGNAVAGFALSLLLTLVMASAASAAPVEGPSGEAFYTPPETLPEGGPGTLVWYRPASLEPRHRSPERKSLGRALQVHGAARRDERRDGHRDRPHGSLDGLRPASGGDARRGHPGSRPQLRAVAADSRRAPSTTPARSSPC